MIRVFDVKDAKIYYGKVDFDWQDKCFEPSKRVVATAKYDRSALSVIMGFIMYRIERHVAGA